MRRDAAKIKVMHFNDGFSFGGVETNLLNLIRSTDGTRFECSVGYANDGELRADFERLQVRLFNFSKKAPGIKNPFGIWIIFKIFIFLIMYKIDIVHTHSFRTHIWAGIAARLAGKKVVEHVHEFRYLDPQEYARRRGTGVRYRYSKYFKFISHKVIVLTRQNKDYVIENGIQPVCNVVLLKNGLLLTDRPKVKDEIEIRKKLGIPEGKKIVLTAARLVAEKNVDLVIRIAHKMATARSDIFFVIAGEGSLFKALSQESASLGNLRMIGYCRDMDGLLSISKVFFLPSFLELHSIGILEAMKAGVPLLVSSGVGANDEFLESGKNAFLRDPFNGEGWAQDLCKLIDDPELVSRMTENAYKTLIAEFDANKITKQIENIYRELMK